MKNKNKSFKTFSSLSPDNGHKYHDLQVFFDYDRYNQKVHHIIYYDEI